MASAAVGMAADTGGQALAALWTAGLGVEWRPLRVVGLDLEERYRVIDRGPHGFWNPGEPRRGFGTALGVSIGFGGASQRSDPSSSAAGPTPAPPARPSSEPTQPPLMLVGRGADVVQTALDVLGSPYQWGGTAENGFDCSGLIQYAYARHGIRLPRTSRDQAVSGAAVPAVIDSLQPGDILAFVAHSGGGVTHVGLYIGEGKFIHSSSTGVKLSRLEADDPEGAYWIPKWVGVRRVLP
jgi:cell wall-associated NlpC family hydrolase